jgi:GMP synthase (glutamine-hydrolysing)
MNDSDSSPKDGRSDPLLILRAGDALPEVAARHGEFAGWIERVAAKAWAGTFAVHDLRSSDPLPDIRSAAGILITGSISSVTDRAAWMLRAEAYIRDIVAAEAPVFGICFGHQLMAQALGGDVQKNPRGREIGTVPLMRVGDDPLFAGLSEPLLVNATHVDTVVVLPPRAAVIARTALDDNAVVAFGPAARGVQFHPEIDRAVMRSYVEARWPMLVDEGLDAEGIHARVSETPEAGELLCNFIRGFVLSPARRAA